MRLNRVVGGLVLLAAMASMMTTVAFKTAAVTNNMAIDIVSTEGAALAMSASSPTDAGVSAVPVSGQLVITITDKMQPGSTYCFSPAFKVSLNSGPTFTFTTPEILDMPAGTTMTLYKSGGGTPCEPTRALSLGNQTVATNSATDIDIQIVVDPGATLTSSSPKIVIKGSR